MFATHAQLKLARISGFRFGLSQSLRFLSLKDRGLWFEITPCRDIKVQNISPTLPEKRKCRNFFSQIALYTAYYTISKMTNDDLKFVMEDVILVFFNLFISMSVNVSLITW